LPIGYKKGQELSGLPFFIDMQKDRGEKTAGYGLRRRRRAIVADVFHLSLAMNKEFGHIWRI
jgi:hypothetical protein